MEKTALITGISGQDGSYLAELLLSKGYAVHGVLRTESYKNRHKIRNLSGIIDQIICHECNIKSQSEITKLINEISPDECYHLAAESFDEQSFSDNLSILDTNINSTFYILNAVKNRSPNTKLFFSGSGLMYANSKESPQNENTYVNPQSIYGITKAASFFAVKSIREKFGIYACTGIAYNHESIRRGQNFVTRKITLGVSDIYHGKSDKIVLGSLNAIRDWGYAPDYVDAMWKMLNNPKGPKDYILATGIPHTVQDIINVAFHAAGYDDPEKYIESNNKYIRSNDQTLIIGDNSQIYSDLGWKPSKSFEDIITEMTLYDLDINNRM